MVDASETTQNVNLKRKIADAKTDFDFLQKARKNLPVYKVGDKFLEHFRRHETLIIIGETGSGKTTQIPQLLIDSDLFKFKSDPTKNNFGRAICCTQPRRISATSIANRVSDERGQILGSEVGYSIRFEDKSDSFKTKIRYMTDGMLVRESVKDPLFKRYGVIIVDEVHERTVNTDILLTQLKKAQELRIKSNFHGYPLRLIIMSATMNVDNFRRFFTGIKNNVPPVLYVEGRQFQIDCYYLSENPDDYVNSTVSAISQIHQKVDDRSESILSFLTGQDEIEAVKTKLVKLFPGEMMIVPLYAALPSHLQMLAFEEPKKKTQRKVIIATNIAETSITVSGIKHVIDSGKVKQKSHKNGMDLLQVEDISKAQAWQRAGRTGRDSCGSVYRLYTEDHFEKLIPQIVPEIQRISISNVLLHLYRLGKNTEQVRSFNFIDQPEKAMYDKAIAELEFLGAVKNGNLTEIGRKMSEFPVEPCLSRALLYASEFKCFQEMLTIVACLSVDTIFHKPNSSMSETKVQEIQQAHSKFFKPSGDAISFYEVFRGWMAIKDVKKKREFCKENYLHNRNLDQASKIRKQLRMTASGIEDLNLDSSSRDDLKVVQKSLCFAFMMNLAELNENDSGSYVQKFICGNIGKVKKIEDMKFHPSSSLAYLKLKLDFKIFIRF